MSYPPPPPPPPGTYVTTHNHRERACALFWARAVVFVSRMCWVGYTVKGTPLFKMAQNGLCGKDYQDKFKASDYLKSYYDGPASDFIPVLRCYHEVFKSLPSGLTILDYGSGAVVITTISASVKASEIVWSDYTEHNREALRQWLDGHPDAFVWSSVRLHLWR